MEYNNIRKENPITYRICASKDKGNIESFIKNMEKELKY